MQNKKRVLAVIANDEDDDCDDEVVIKKRKIDQSNDDLDVDNVVEKQSIGEIIMNVMTQQLQSIFGVPDAIIEIIFEYSKTNHWYHNRITEIENEQFENEIDIVRHQYQQQNCNVFVRTKDGEIWCKGENKYFQLGLGHDYNVKEFILLKYFIKKKIQIKKIWLSSAVTATVWEDESAKLYACGSNDFNRFGFGNLKIISYPRLIKGIENVQRVAISPFHMIVLDKNGAVFGTKMCDENDYGQNGDGNENFGNKSENFHQINFFKHTKIIDISVGRCHTLFVEQNGVVWTCGIGNHNTSGFYPAPIDYLTNRHIKIKQCASGDRHNLLLNEKGNVYAFGYNYFGQCGLNAQNFEIYNPTMIQMTEKIENIQCGIHHSYMKSVKNIHFLFGSNIVGQCAFGTMIDTFKIIKPLMINNIIQQKTIHRMIEINKVFIDGYCTTVETMEIL